ncbi:hypothetical protein Mal4_08990 [Maioricimonas rarisocia]|uniref:Uncharacterized protein n=1 Tax=Maioricimonas rarisocia TaxID=2528026 RepID=A0A517Z2B2_9PLAN|nr:hypothetical protein [Maioricimonas rarisocia]QDU36612.1 hypothetical protein Mal4_08990 [Maioricimonas rarisocia]
MLRFRSSTPRWRLPAPGMLLASTLSLVCLLALLIWSATDASFAMARWKACVCTGLERLDLAAPGVADSLGITAAITELQWNRLGKRVALLGVLIASGLVAAFAAVIFCLQKPSARRGLTCGLLVVGWVAWVIAQPAIDEWRIRRQVTEVLPRFEKVAAALSPQWPSEPGTIAPGLDYYVDAERHPDFLMLQLSDRVRYPFHEGIGLTARRDKQGVIHFELAAAANAGVEFRPDDSAPALGRSIPEQFLPPVSSAVRLKERWYLVQYGTSQ